MMHEGVFIEDPRKERFLFLVLFGFLPILIFILAASGALSDRGFGQYFAFFVEDATGWLLPFLGTVYLSIFVAYLKMKARKEAERGINLIKGGLGFLILVTIIV